MSATMTFDQLTTALTPAPDGQLSVVGSALGGASVETLFDAYLAGGALSLTGATATPSIATQTVTVSGALAGGQLLAFPAGSVAGATFVLEPAGTVTARIPVVVAGDWPLSQAFPDTAGGVFDALLVSGATLTLDSTVPTTLPADFRIALGYPPDEPLVAAHTTQGLALDATITLESPLADDLAALVARSLSVSGPISVYRAPVATDAPSDQSDPAAQMLLRPVPSAGPTVTVGGYSMAFSTEIALVLQQLPSSTGATVGVIPTGLLALTTSLATRTVEPFPVSVQVYDISAQRMVLEAGVPPTTTFDPDGLPAMLGGASPSALLAGLPTGFPILQDLRLTGASITINTSPLAIDEITLALDLAPSAAPWSVLGLVDVTDVGLRISAARGSTGLVPAADVFATGTIHDHSDLTLEVFVSLPDLTISAAASESGTFDLTQVIQSHLGVVLPLPTLTGSTLAVRGDVASGTYSLHAAITDTWQLVGTAPSGLTVDGFVIDIATDGAATSASVAAGFTLAGRNVLIGASDDGGAWTFYGRTLPGAPIDLSDLVTDVMDVFDIDLRGVPIPAVTLTDLELVVTPGVDGAGTAFTLVCDGTVGILGQDLVIDVTVDHATDPVATTFTGSLEVAGQTFVADFTSQAATTAIVFVWQPTVPLDLVTLVQSLGITLPPIPGGLDLTLKTASISYGTAGDGSTIGVSATCAHATIAFVRFPRPVPLAGGAAPDAWALVLTVLLGLDLADLPVVGPMIPADADATVDAVEVVIVSDAFSAADVSTANRLLQSIDGPTLPTATMAAGPTLALTLGGPSPTSFALPLGSGEAPPPAGPAPSSAAAGFDATVPAATPATAPDPGTLWKTVGATLGPATLRRVGVQYRGGTLSLLFDASLELGPLTVGLDGLGIGSTLATLDLEPQLSGLSIDFSAGPIDVSGGLLVDQSPPPAVSYQYIGALTVTAEEWTLVGEGAYAKIGDASSFFVFAEVEGDFGGPPAFFVTGLLGGVGSNYALTIPSPDQVADFPFLANMGGPGLGPPDQVLTTLTGGSGGPAWLTPEVGTTWGAIGVEFTSFDLVHGKLLLVVEVGHDVQIALLGRASMSLPQGGTEGYAYVELQLEAVVDPDQGYLGITASLTSSSYLLTPACHLTGGFAFCTWYGDNAHAGDFVLTAGGYHPAFAVPAWYPQVAPVGFDWQVSGDITVSGSAYVALTPSALMAGGNLSAVFASGDLRAWFAAWMNVLITWKPFHFEAEIGISVGASYRMNLLFTTVTLSIELGAQLEVWGPPTGGTVHVDWYIISFSVSFGADRSSGDDQTLTWAQVTELLPGATIPAAPAAQLASGPAGDPPETTGVLAAQVNRGLIAQDGDTWIVRPDELSFTFTSSIPASTVTWGPHASPLVETVTSAGIQVRPMNLDPGTPVTSALAIDVTLDGVDVALDAWSPVARIGNLPGSLWGRPLHGATPTASNDTVPGTVGARLTAPRAQEGASPGPVAIDELIDAVAAGPRILDPATQPAVVPAPTIGDTRAAIARAFAPANLEATQSAQQQIVAALHRYGAGPTTTATTAALATDVWTAFAAAPMEVAG